MDDGAKRIVEGYQAGKKLARESLGIGKPFLGSWGVAKALGYHRESLEWKGANIGAMEIFQTFEIYIDDQGNITAMVEE